MFERSSIRTRLLALLVVPTVVLAVIAGLMAAASLDGGAAVLSSGTLLGIVAAMVLLAILLLLVLIRDVLRPLRDLAALAGEVRDGLPETIDLLAAGEPTAGSPFDGETGAALVTRPDELGDLARVMQATTVEATRVAVGQAATRAGTNRTIEDVARREQALVQRQLALLDQLEDAESDPDQLAQLFRLDHLATRMRRNAENLLLLASGQLPGGHDSPPMPLVDVARTAAAEIEQYDRVDVRVGVFDTVLGHAATPVSHLLAEVVENATQFSPPSTRVLVTARTEAEGVVVAVADQGIGMSEAEMGSARRKLAEPVLLETAESRRLGLYVVGRIGARLGITVDMRSPDDGRGTTVEVHIPRRLFLGDASGGASPPLDLSLHTLSDAAAAEAERFVGETGPPPGLVPGPTGPTPPALPTRSAPAAPQEHPQIGISLSAASGGRTVDVDPSAISALMDGLSGIASDPAEEWPGRAAPQQDQAPAPRTATPAMADDPAPPAATTQPPTVVDAAEPVTSGEAAPPPVRPVRRRSAPARGAAGSSWSTPFPQGLACGDDGQAER